MERPVTIDPRYHDAALFDLDAVVIDPNSATTLLRRLKKAGIATAVYSKSRGGHQVLRERGLADLFDLCFDGAEEACHQLRTDPRRSVVFSDDPAGIEQGRSAGFAVVIGVDRTGHADELLERGADAVVADLADIELRTGDKRMSELPNALESYQQLGLAGRQLFVCLDYDGTLSEIVPDPDSATLAEGANEALEQLAARCPVAILSGRDLADIRTRVGIEDIWYAGSHGFELTGPDGSHHQNDAAASAVSVLETAADELRRDLEPIPGVRVEHKRFAVAVHYRNVAPDRVAEVVAAAHRRGRRHGLRVTGGRKVVELRPNIDWDKGTALRWLADRIQQAGQTLPIYIGDDLTDEDAFDAIRSDGIGIVVRHGEDGGRPTAATFTLNNPTEVAEFLRRVADSPARRRRSPTEP